LLLLLAGEAGAATFNASTAKQLEEAVEKADANLEANTIVLAAGTYVPENPLNFTNKSGVQTIEGPASAPGASISGAGEKVVPSHVVEVAGGTSATAKNLRITLGGGATTSAVEVQPTGTLDVESSALVGNRSFQVLVQPEATLTTHNSTISDGSTFGMINAGTANLFNTTVASNKESGVENKGKLNLTNTIVANNKTGDCVGAANTSDHSLDSDGSCGVGALSKMNPLLGALAGNQGPTPTHALLKGSPAINAGNTATCTTIDQRGFPRPDVAATACDLGAYEFYEPAHVYKNGVIAKEASKLRTLGWGNLKLTNGSVGEVECKSVSAGFAENPTGGGVAVGQMQALFPFECTSASCTALGATIEVTPEKLPWARELFEEPALFFREQTSGINLRVNCVGHTNALFQGEDAPKILNNGTAVGLKPGEAEFDAGAGELPSEGFGGAKLAGKLKVQGYAAQELIEVRNP
jgi:hypothetical protein